MKYWIFALILALPFTLVEPEGKEVQCLQQMAKELEITEEKLTESLMICSVKLLEGEKIYINSGKGWQNLRMRLYPRTIKTDDRDPDMNETEKASRIFEHTNCQLFSAAQSMYMKQCLGESNETRRNDQANRK